MNREYRILFVEDDLEYRKLIQSILENEGYIVDAVESSLKGIDLFEENKYNLVISDLKLETLDGTQFIKFIKKVDQRTRTMILTASPTEDSEQAALELNIDKYIVKETRMDIFLKYVEYLMALSESINSSRHEVLTSAYEELVLDLNARKLTKKDKEIPLTNKQFGIMRILLGRKGEAVSRDEIIEELWDGDFEDIDTRIIDGYIKELRKKINIQSIVSIRGYGYKWDE